MYQPLIKFHPHPAIFTQVLYIFASLTGKWPSGLSPILTLCYHRLNHRVQRQSNYITIGFTHYAGFLNDINKNIQKTNFFTGE